MTPTPDAKGAQPEQLVEKLRNAAKQSRQLDKTHIAIRTDTAESIATALSECRERGKLLETVARAARDARNEFVRDYAIGADRVFDELDAALDALAAQPPSEASERSGT